MLVLHYTGMPSAEGALDRLCDPRAAVSSHWLIEEDGTVWSLVDERRRAWHAGVSSWQGRRRLNDVSVGIELVNPGHEWGYRPFPETQMQACRTLCRAIMARWRIAPERVLGHSDIAPARKTDPGELFDWAGLAAEGIGVWPDPVGHEDMPSLSVVQAGLATYGYGVPSHGEDDRATREAVAAFQRHFRPALVTGVVDIETWSVLAALLRMQDLPTGAPDA
ncbi:N-acetylmuramoyl-L-alanine amidase [Marinivivus vitaminiproducens]|uniref:N-acetylmuramoyl-L-alanine amidase n=1 Tax=Marinivivus vitaminiproducens TaxID=3035935 RepID=UPI00279915CC|nr:N-acetylmuramoyl-L-alanine amidase [Geminicoccaceae bacterium SCSIO 64248]